MADTRRQALYFPADMLEELQREAKRQDRHISWLIQQAWKIAYRELQKIPSTTDYIPQDYRPKHELEAEAKANAEGGGGEDE